MNKTPKMASYITSVLDNNLYCVTNGQFIRHLRHHGLTYQQYYENYISGKKEKCPFCSKPKTFYQRNHSYAKTCGSNECYGQLIKEIKAKFSADYHFEFWVYEIDGRLTIIK